VHPVHNNGADYGGKKWFGGSSEYIPNRTTEWLLQTHPFAKTTITIDPKQWHGRNLNKAVGQNGVGQFASPVFPISVVAYESNENAAIPPCRWYEGSVQKSLVFKFCIVIENPDPTTQAVSPYLFSELSDVVKIYPKMGTTNSVKTFYAWKVSVGNPSKST
jgi:hypothetical protein